MPTVFASVSITLVLFYLVTLGMAYAHALPVGLHMLWGFFMAILIVLLQCLVFGFFIGSGKSIKRVVEENGLEKAWIQKTKDYKNRSYPMLMLAILVSAAAAIMGGGVSVGAVPLWVHETLVWAALVLNIDSLWISYRVVVENVRDIHQINREVSASRREKGLSEDGFPPEPPQTPSRPPASPAAKFYFLGLAVWVPYAYMKFSLGSRTFPYWPFLVLSCLFFLWGLGLSLADRHPSG
jgi:hypothetical protein